MINDRMAIRSPFAFISMRFHFTNRFKLNESTYYYQHVNWEKGVELFGTYHFVVNRLYDLFDVLKVCMLVENEERKKNQIISMFNEFLSFT